MSYYISNRNFKSWLDRAQTALVSKNKVRKDLWTDFCDILVFEEREDSFHIPKSAYTTIATFLQIEGRSDSLKDDSILNWVNTLHDLRKSYNSSLTHAEEEEEVEQKEEKEEEKQAGPAIHTETPSTATS